MGVKAREWKGAWWVFVNHQHQRKARRIGGGADGKKAAKEVDDLLKLQSLDEVFVKTATVMADYLCASACMVLYRPDVQKTEIGRLPHVYRRFSFFHSFHVSGAAAIK